MTETPSIVSSRRRGTRALLFGGVILLVVVGGAVLYGMRPAGKEADLACAASAGKVARLDPLVKGEIAALGLKNPVRSAPDLTFQGPDGKPVKLSEFHGKTVLVNFWATWCVPCRQEMPALGRLQAKRGGPDFAVVAVNVDTARLDRPKIFLAETGVTDLTFYADPSADVLQALKADGQLVGLPTTLLVDRDGCELGVMAGPAEWSSPEAERLIDAAKG